ncbi:MAG TPA: hypothetical protein VEY12_03120 [Thermoplasmata archaeon]|nr:hypothetical protein [Thermoplasmata archaeon]
MTVKRELVVVGVGIVIIDILIWWFGVGGSISLAWSLGSMGIITLLGMLLLGYVAKGAFERDGIQLAILASVLAVYFGMAPVLVFVGVGTASKDLATTFIGNLTSVVEVVIGFYAGTAVADHAVRTWGRVRAPDPDRAKLID